jgi:hypothetical protein
MLAAALRPGGLFALCKNNPWNPRKRLVMRSIPFDRDAAPLSHRMARRLLRTADLRFSARTFVHLPALAWGSAANREGTPADSAGGQYMILARKPAGGDGQPRSLEMLCPS